jgi:predicted RNase H-like HicB family nuclease
MRRVLPATLDWGSRRRSLWWEMRERIVIAQKTAPDSSIKLYAWKPERGESGVIIAVCDDLGLTVEGDTLEDAMEAAQEATRSYFEILKEDGDIAEVPHLRWPEDWA